MIDVSHPPPDPITDNPERPLLVEFLDYYRAVLLRKADGLTAEQLRTRVAGSTLTIGGLVKHMALVEHCWFQERWLGGPELEPWASVDWDAKPDWDFESAADDPPERLVATYQAAIAHSDEVLAACDDLGATVEHRGAPLSMRWILVHMIEEYARHCGHADLIRESIDGRTGD